MRNRGVTTAFNYVILLAITSILMSTLIFGVSSLVTSQQTDGIQAEFKVYGNELAKDISTVSRLATQIDLNGQGSVEIVTDLPQRIVGTQYTVALTEISHPRYELTFRTDRPDVVVTIAFKVDSTKINAGDVETGTFNGGPIGISYTENGQVRLSDD